MNVKKILSLLLALLLVGSMAACGNKPAENQNNNDGEPQTVEEAKALYDQLMAQETEILTNNSELWEKVFLSADKGMAMMESGNNYGDFLLKTIEAAKDKFDEKELALLTAGATEIKDLEDQMAALEEKFPGLLDAPSGGMSVPSEDVPSDGIVSGGTTADSNATKFPAFTGKDLDSNDVSSDKLFSGNAFTLGGDAAAIADAKDVLTKSGATYQNVYFDADSEAGKFTENVYAYPTTYVVDRNGNIVGDPIVGAITGDGQMEALQALIDTALANDKG